jgi:hypothetical protein
MKKLLLLLSLVMIVLSSCSYSHKCGTGTSGRFNPAKKTRMH